MENKYICKSCGEDLREVGLYYMDFNTCVYNSEKDIFEYSSTCSEVSRCNSCDEFIGFEIN